MMNTEEDGHADSGYFVSKCEWPVRSSHCIDCTSECPGKIDHFKNMTKRGVASWPVFGTGGGSWDY